MKYKDKKKRGFTLIELIAILVILALIALIATPLVMNIVKKAKDSANKRSVDAYGKAVELAVATHLLDTGDYPTSLDNLTVEYTGNEVVCNIKNLNEDGSIYLSECSVKGAEVKDSNTEDGYYHYGKTSTTAYQSYAIGDVITYNGIDFYVIENSDSKSDRVTMLKVEPLSFDEVNTYGGVGTDNNHVNMYTDGESNYYQIASLEKGYGGVQWYSSSTCGYPFRDGYYAQDQSGCINDYKQSEIKYIVDAWALGISSTDDLVDDEFGYKARLIAIDDLTNNLGYSLEEGSSTYSSNTSLTPDWVYGNYWYWTMSAGDEKEEVYAVQYEESSPYPVSVGQTMVIRPVITLKKSVI